MPYINPQNSNVHGANMGPTWVLSAPGGPHVGPTNLAIRAITHWYNNLNKIYPHTVQLWHNYVKIMCRGLRKISSIFGNCACCVEFTWENIKHISILNHFSMLRWHRLLKPFPVEGKDPFIIYTIITDVLATQGAKASATIWYWNGSLAECSGFSTRNVYIERLVYYIHV